MTRQVVKEFSHNKGNLIASIQYLIELYYMIYSKPKNEWPRNKIYLSIGKIISELIGGKWKNKKLEGREGVEFFPETYENGSLENIKDHTYIVHDEDIKKFVAIMNDLINVIRENETIHLELIGTNETLKTAVKENENLNDSSQGSINDQSKCLSSRHGKNIFIEVIPLIKKSIKNTVRENITTDLKYRFHTISVTRDIRYRIIPHSAFGKKILPHKKDSKIKLARHFTSPAIKNFKRLSYYIIVHFHLEFGGFERLKICENCGKLFFETKNGFKKYCNDPCRKKRYDSSEPIMKKRCRERQNKWANNKQLIGRIYRDDHCEKCEIKPLPKSGFCHIIKARNEKIILAL